MIALKLDKMSTDELVERFAEISTSQDDATFHDQYSKYNRLYGQMQAVDDELRRRGRDARLALCSLYRHSNLQVRLQAATWTLAVAPTEARQMLENIYRSKLYPQAAEAGMLLAALDDGTFEPE